MASSLYAKIFSLCPLILFTISLVVFTTSHVEARRNLAWRRNLASTEGPHIEAAMVTILPTSETKLYGVRAQLSVWQPSVSTPTDISSSTMTIELTDVAIEAGWLVYPERYNDSKPHLYVGWANKEVGCIDLDCEGFRLFDGVSAIGKPLEPVSVVGSDISFIKVEIAQVTSTGDWQLTIGTDPIGIWPASLFTGIEPGAKKIYLGGLVFDSIGSTVHTKTDMGNGKLPDLATQEASVVCSVEYLDASLAPQSPTIDMLGLHVTNPLCYNAELLPETTDKLGICFLYGGSGSSSACRL